MKKISLMIALLLISLSLKFLLTERTVFATEPENTACESFGVQRYQLKKPSPAFSLKDLNGNLVSLSDFRGKPVLIVFWATWCESCKEEMPILEKFGQEKKQKLIILFITIDGERKSAAQKIVNANKITLPVLLLLKEKTMDHYGVRGWVPQTYLVDQEGILIGKIIGQRDWASEQAWSCIKNLFGLP